MTRASLPTRGAAQHDRVHVGRVRPALHFFCARIEARRRAELARAGDAAHAARRERCATCAAQLRRRLAPAGTTSNRSDADALRARGHRRGEADEREHERAAQPHRPCSTEAPPDQPKAVLADPILEAGAANRPEGVLITTGERVETRPVSRRYTTCSVSEVTAVGRDAADVALRAEVAAPEIEAAALAVEPRARRGWWRSSLRPPCRRARAPPSAARRDPRAPCSRSRLRRWRRSGSPRSRRTSCPRRGARPRAAPAPRRRRASAAPAERQRECGSDERARAAA